MKTSIGSLVLCVSVCTSLDAGSVFEKQFIETQMERVVDYQNSKAAEFYNNDWIRGTYYAGIMAAFQTTGNQRFLDQCFEWGESLNWEIPDKATDRYGSGFYSLACAQIWMQCYFEDGKASMLEPTISYLEDPSFSVPISRPLDWYFENSGLRFVDGLFTSPPALVMLYRITGEEKYLDWLDACFWDIYGELFDKEEGLFYRDIRYKQGYQGVIEARYHRPENIPHGKARTTYIYQKTENGKKVLWSRGNGWAFAGLTRILKYLPRTHGNYERYVALFREMSASLKARQQEDGFWRPNLADPLDYDLKESSGTSCFTYGIAWGIHAGILPRESYLPVIQKAWPALVSVISEEGKVQWGQLPAGAPYQVRKEDSMEYVSGMFLLAASEVYRLEFDGDTEE